MTGRKRGARRTQSAPLGSMEDDNDGSDGPNDAFGGRRLSQQRFRSSQHDRTPRGANGLGCERHANELHRRPVAAAVQPEQHTEQCAVRRHPEHCQQQFWPNRQQSSSSPTPGLLFFGQARHVASSTLHHNFSAAVHYHGSHLQRQQSSSQEVAHRVAIPPPPPPPPPEFRDWPPPPPPLSDISKINAPLSHFHDGTCWHGTLPQQVDPPHQRHGDTTTPTPPTISNPLTWQRPFHSSALCHRNDDTGHYTPHQHQQEQTLHPHYDVSPSHLHTFSTFTHPQLLGQPNASFLSHLSLSSSSRADNRADSNIDFAMSDLTTLSQKWNSTVTSPSTKPISFRPSERLNSLGTTTIEPCRANVSSSARTHGVTSILPPDQSTVLRIPSPPPLNDELQRHEQHFVARDTPSDSTTAIPNRVTLLLEHRATKARNKRKRQRNVRARRKYLCFDSQKGSESISCEGSSDRTDEDAIRAETAAEESECTLSQTKSNAGVANAAIIASEMPMRFQRDHGEEFEIGAGHASDMADKAGQNVASIEALQGIESEDKKTLSSLAPTECTVFTETSAIVSIHAQEEDMTSFDCPAIATSDNVTSDYVQERNMTATNSVAFATTNTVTRTMGEEKKETLSEKKGRLAMALKRAALEKAKVRLHAAQKKKEAALAAASLWKKQNSSEIVSEVKVASSSEIASSTDEKKPSPITALQFPNLNIRNIGSSGPADKVRPIIFSMMLPPPSVREGPKLDFVSRPALDVVEQAPLEVAARSVAVEQCSSSTTTIDKSSDPENATSARLDENPKVEKTEAFRLELLKRRLQLTLLKLRAKRKRLKLEEGGTESSAVVEKNHTDDVPPSLGVLHTTIGLDAIPEKPTSFELVADANALQSFTKIENPASFSSKSRNVFKTAMAERSADCFEITPAEELPHIEHLSVEQLRERQRTLRQDIDASKLNQKELRHNIKVSNLSDLVTRQRVMLIQQGKKLVTTSTLLKECVEEIKNETEQLKASEKRLEELLKRNRIMEGIALTVTRKLMKCRKRRDFLLKRSQAKKRNVVHLDAAPQNARSVAQKRSDPLL